MIYLHDRNQKITVHGSYYQIFRHTTRLLAILAGIAIAGRSAERIAANIGPGLAAGKTITLQFGRNR